MVPSYAWEMARNTIEVGATWAAVGAGVAASQPMVAAGQPALSERRPADALPAPRSLGLLGRPRLCSSAAAPPGAGMLERARQDSENVAPAVASGKESWNRQKDPNAVPVASAEVAASTRSGSKASIGARAPAALAAQPRRQGPGRSASAGVLSDVTNTTVAYAKPQSCHRHDAAQAPAQPRIRAPAAGNIVVAEKPPASVPAAQPAAPSLPQAAPSLDLPALVSAAGAAAAAPGAARATAAAAPHAGADVLRGTTHGAAESQAQAQAQAGDQHADVDAAHSSDPQHVVEYLPDIYRHLQREESRNLPQLGYMERQPHVNNKMRGILVDWLVDVHKKYKLRNETLFLTVALIDRFLERRVTQRNHLQLVGVSALLIAAKYEELYPPQVHEFVYVTDKAYSKEEVLRMEAAMLSTLNFEISCPTAAHFFERYQRINGCTDAHRDLARYLLELTLLDYKMIRYTPSHVAAAAVLMSNKLLRRQPSWTPAAVKHTKLTEQMLKPCAKDIGTLLGQAETHALQAVRRKFSQQKLHAVAKIKFPGSPASVGPPRAPASTPTGYVDAAPSASTTTVATTAPVPVRSNQMAVEDPPV
eukprot:TRINITY_DN3463_c0_g1_i2.p1 TRINITY_DN3463_c0_g1~~TRINITY_DN3463_c0_g1_i2.p1  ORF type:complete len:590 (+),score=144.28 TRINITY_DN3463_c0_g1_i2:87-1856(+)